MYAAILKTKLKIYTIRKNTKKSIAKIIQIIFLNANLEFTVPSLTGIQKNFLI